MGSFAVDIRPSPRPSPRTGPTMWPLADLIIIKSEKEYFGDNHLGRVPREEAPSPTISVYFQLNITGWTWFFLYFILRKRKRKNTSLICPLSRSTVSLSLSTWLAEGRLKKKTPNTEREKSPPTTRTRAMDPDSVAKAFVEHYYSTFDANRAGLANLYQDGSMLTFEGQKIMGSPNIVAKLTSLPFQQCQHQISTVDCQPSGPAGGMLVFVSGNLQLAGEQHALKFSQVYLRTLVWISVACDFFFLYLFESRFGCDSWPDFWIGWGLGLGDWFDFWGVCLIAIGYCWFVDFLEGI